MPVLQGCSVRVVDDRRGFVVYDLSVPYDLRGFREGGVKEVAAG